MSYIRRLKQNGFTVHHFVLESQTLLKAFIVQISNSKKCMIVIPALKTEEWLCAITKAKVETPFFLQHKIGNLLHRHDETYLGCLSFQIDAQTTKFSMIYCLKTVLRALCNRWSGIIWLDQALSPWQQGKTKVSTVSQRCDQLSCFEEDASCKLREAMKTNMADEKSKERTLERTICS